LRRDAETVGGLEVDVWRRLAARYLLRRDGDAEAVGEAGEPERFLEHLPVRGRREGQREGIRSPPHRRDRARQQRQLAPVGLEHPLDDFAVDRVRVVRHACVVMQVPRPLGRAHSHHRPLHRLVIPAAALAHVALAHRVPDLLRLEQHSVEVEDDCFRQTEW
jgi:hypothetical protein